VDAAAGLPPRWAQTQLIDVAFGSLSPGDRLEAMTALGHDARFPSPRLSAGCGFRKETIAGSAAMGETRRFRTFSPLLPNGAVRLY
jgi:hypothetical protein